MLFRENNGKYRPFVRFTLSKDKSAMIFSYFFANSESYTGSRIFYLAMEPLKNLKNLICIFLFKPNTIVLYFNPVVIDIFCKAMKCFLSTCQDIDRNFDPWNLIFFPELQSISNEVAE